MGALVGGFGIPESWRRVVPAAAIPVSLALLFTLVTIPPAQATPVATPEVDESQTPEAPAVADEPLTAADAVSAAAIARLTNEPVEILAERTEFGSVLALPNGSLAAGQGSGPVWVRQGGDGTAVEDWAAVDLTLEFSEDGLVRPVAQSADLVLSGGSATDGTSPSSDTATKPVGPK
ncbi:hypothetical protein [Cellulomonas timonensis]|uniref:hypothetical protein n=1 Tax=Cellulomonas timonensis TaxID=1689271 RepID=UPI000AD76AFE|nr:hypothetical protein [Cellulomonas timonensis]